MSRQDFCSLLMEKYEETKQPKPIAKSTLTSKHKTMARPKHVTKGTPRQKAMVIRFLQIYDSLQEEYNRKADFRRRTSILFSDTADLELIPSYALQDNDSDVDEYTEMWPAIVCKDVIVPPKPQGTSRLITLPVEILLNIYRQLPQEDSLADIVSLGLTCTLLYRVLVTHYNKKPLLLNWRSAPDQRLSRRVEDFLGLNYRSQRRDAAGCWEFHDDIGNRQFLNRIVYGEYENKQFELARRVRWDCYLLFEGKLPSPFNLGLTWYDRIMHISIQNATPGPRKDGDYLPGDIFIGHDNRSFSPYWEIVRVYRRYMDLEKITSQERARVKLVVELEMPRQSPLSRFVSLIMGRYFVNTGSDELLPLD